MRRTTIAVLSTMLAAALMTGCGGYNARENTIYILKNGRIVSTDVESYDPELYEEGELEAFVDQTIKSFNASYGEKAVQLKKLKVKDGLATIILEYESDAVYTTFNGIGLFMGSIPESREAGFIYDGDFVSLKDGNIELCGVDDFLGNDSYKVAIFEGNDMNVQFPGKILYASARYAQLSDKNMIRIASDASMMGTPDEDPSKSEDATGSTEQTGTEAVSEGSENDDATGGAEEGGAITDDELLAAEEAQPDTQTGESEYFADDKDSPVKDAYVFVIYK